MKIEINLDETRFKDLVDNELGKFSDEEIHDILQKAINQYVMENDVIEKFFYNKKKDWNGKETGELEPTLRFEKLINGIDVEKTMAKLKSDLQSFFEKDDTIKLLAESIFYRFISGKISTLMWNSGDLHNMIQLKANNILDERLKNQ